MKIEISVFTAIVILFVLHTVLTHLFNWWFRKTMSSSYDTEGVISVLLYTFEIVLILGFLNTLIK